MPRPSSDRLELLYRISQSINSSLDLNTVLNALIDEGINIYFDLGRTDDAIQLLGATEKMVQ